MKLTWPVRMHPVQWWLLRHPDQNQTKTLCAAGVKPGSWSYVGRCIRYGLPITGIAAAQIADYTGIPLADLHEARVVSLYQAADGAPGAAAVSPVDLYMTVQRMTLTDLLLFAGAKLDTYGAVARAAHALKGLPADVAADIRRYTGLPLAALTGGKLWLSTTPTATQARDETPAAASAF